MIDGHRSPFAEFLFIPSALRTLWLAALSRLSGAIARTGSGRAARARVQAAPAFAPRLMLRPDGAVRCDACGLCAIACPVKCIAMEAGEGAPSSFEIDMLACICCNACVEACPCDALRMDAGPLPPPSADRASFVYDLARLRANHPADASPLSRAL
ncbi:MAG: hypothetical protein JXA24_06975 [Proteobacteria bacterium]|nr:hypothetical protein [Pseudomonadota bacterium]